VKHFAAWILGAATVVNPEVLKDCNADALGQNLHMEINTALDDKLIEKPAL
jgi:hypothetical protein